MSTYWPTTTTEAPCKARRAHSPHGECPGVTDLDTVTRPQVVAVAKALGLDPARLSISLDQAKAAQR